jgi:hypothetical protein
MQLRRSSDGLDVIRMTRSVSDVYRAKLSILIVALWVHSSLAQVIMDGDLVSKFGGYSGYTKPMYEDWVRSSQYVKMEDGVKLAADTVRPAQSGEPVDFPMPVVWAYYRYHRLYRNSRYPSSIELRVYDVSKSRADEG